jgi:amino acid transporter
MNHPNRNQFVFRRIGKAFFICFGGAYVCAIVGIVILYYCLPASDAAKTSWFPIILFDPFVITVAFFVASIPALGAFVASLLFIVINWFFNKSVQDAVEIDDLKYELEEMKRKE